MQHSSAKSVRRVVALAAVFSLSLANLSAENWPHWRGPLFNGSTSERNLPDDLSKTNGVKWIAPLPGPSAATPIVWRDHVFVSSTDAKAKTLHALAFDRSTGRPLWQQFTGTGFNKDERSTYASPSPVTDGRRVVFLYGTGDVVAFDFKGNKLWARNLQKDYGAFAYQWTYGASPTLHDEKLFIVVLQRDVPVHGQGRTDGPNESYLLALDPQTGKELWRHLRPNEAREESKEAYSTPIPFQHEGRDELFITGGDCISGHEVKSGREFWRWGAWNLARERHWRLVPSAVAGGGVVLACAPKGGPVYALKLGGQGALPDSAVVWKSSDRAVSSDVCTPLFYQGRFYVLNGEKRILSRIEPATGEVEWTGELGGRAKIEASPTGADGRIWFQDFRANVFVVEAAAQFKLLRVIPLADEGENDVRSTIAVAQGNLFIRTGSKLYCFGR